MECKIALGLPVVPEENNINPASDVFLNLEPGGRRQRRADRTVAAAAHRNQRCRIGRVRVPAAYPGSLTGGDGEGGAPLAAPC